VQAEKPGKKRVGIGILTALL
jgi:hypothetical protein